MIASSNPNKRSPEVSDAHDKLALRMAHLHALIASITSDDFSSFDSLSERWRHDLLWLVFELVSDAEDARKQLARA